MIDALIDADARYAAAQQARSKEIDERWNNLAAAHEARSKEIDERLNALITVVDDLVRRRN